VNEGEARDWLRRELNVSRETLTRLEQYVGFLLEAAQRQNLIAPSTLDQVWSRHIVDCAQLVLHATSGELWMDIGSGAGLPGMVVALVSPRPMILVEPRRLRLEFLQQMIDVFGLSNSRAVPSVADETRPAIISARAVAPLDKLFAIGAPAADEGTRWLLPKGRSARTDLEKARRTWQGQFRLVQSVTDKDALIVVADKVRKGAR
jgi:16S rRNA (guanine527-N7)-methyltransferase